MAKNAEVKVIVDAEQPEPTEVIAASIIKISDGFAKLLKGGLNRRALLVLIKDNTNVPMHEVSRVLDCLPRLKEIYCDKPKVAKR